MILGRDLFKCYKNGTIGINGIDLGIQKGDILGILGPNAAGKSTTLEILMGILP